MANKLSELLPSLGMEILLMPIFLNTEAVPSPSANQWDFWVAVKTGDWHAKRAAAGLVTMM